MLTDRIILITGAEGHLGRVLSKGFAAEGATVILLGKNIQKLTALYDDIEAAGYPQPAIYPMDLATTTALDYQRLEDTLETQFGCLDGLVHTAAFLGSLTPLEYYAPEQWQQVMQINLHSAFLLSQATLPLLKRSDRATIIFSNTPLDEHSKAYWGAYGISQWAREGMAKILSEECKTHTHIRVHCVCPDKLSTGLRHKAYPLEDKGGLVKPEAVLEMYLNCMV